MFKLLFFVIIAFCFLATCKFIWTKWLKTYLEKEEIIDGSENETDKQSTTGESTKHDT